MISRVVEFNSSTAVKKENFARHAVVRLKFRGNRRRREFFPLFPPEIICFLPRSYGKNMAWKIRSHD
jgi:hypothetical protein